MKRKNERERQDGGRVGRSLTGRKRRRKQGGAADVLIDLVFSMLWSEGRARPVIAQNQARPSRRGR